MHIVEQIKDNIQVTPFAGLTFRGLQGIEDCPLLLAVFTGSLQADKIVEKISLESIARWYAPSDKFTPSRDILIASVDGSNGEPPIVIGYSRVGWYTSGNDIRLYYQDSFLLEEWRGKGIWQAMVRQNESRLRQIAADHPATTHKFFQGWAADTQLEWISVLESKNYQVVRRFHNMLHHLDKIPERLLPAEFAVRPVQPDHFRKIWETQKDINEGLFEYVAEDWTEEKYQAWRVNPSHTPHLWQVAWYGDQVTGMVLTRINEAENKARYRKRGYTEHIFVRQPWRNRGLASALIARSLTILKAQGIDEAELGVDAENESEAFGLYQRLGYKTESIDTWFRKPMGTAD